jgi:hypothetical protein|tara:strand:+ start:1331 stop:1633 length:303 start_codon:yes stop_codon:yes gene_type:complete
VESGKNDSAQGLTDREKGFLAHLARKYEPGEDAGLVRSYLIATAGIFALFALARWTPWWWVALIVAETLALAGFQKYKKFAAFKTRILVKLWRERAKDPA